ncbi:Sterol uptake control protein 2 [Pleurostoma richardsiae]|uniref:Sterol uptake control protein 2 n=1 Tax=Pleurostoma richardsiae TaxID=41990 RepID=A0AA38RP80_9PEZI|nr:Sterol uptake control protein 2 [Pleurostoma richardsiae]
MVYCGKPSKGCSNCRERKIRCDQREPGCGQCEKREQQCPGYRNMVDLMFRDESSHVIKKAKAKARRKSGGMSAGSGSSPERASSATPPDSAVQEQPRGKRRMLDTTRPAESSKQPAADDSFLPSPESGNWPAIPVGASLYTLAPSCQERGMAYFFSRYVTIDVNSCHQRFDFVYDIWKPVSLLPGRQVDGVLASMTAVGLMGLANMTHSRNTIDAARKSYGIALNLTNNALRDPAEAVKDTTMLSVLILGLFEMMTEANHRTLKAWQQHIDGAAALAKLRGMSQFRTRSGIRMFLMLCQNVMISCIQKELPMPPTLVELRDELAKIFKTDEPSIEISRPIYMVLQLRYDIKRGNISDPDTMVDKLNAVEDEFDSVMSAFPESWQYRVFRVSRQHPAVFRSICHVYPAMWIATIWNGLRTCRILVLETIVSELNKLLKSGTITDGVIFQRYEREHQKARSKLERLQRAIIASVPQHFGLLDPLGSYVDTLTPMSSAQGQADLGDDQLCDPPSEQDSLSSTTSDEGLTLRDLNQAEDPEEGAERYMLLASATNSIVWPLYLIGMSSACSNALRQYVVGRLYAVYKETGSTQAKTVADIIVNRKSSPLEQVRLPLRTHEGLGV